MRNRERNPRACARLADGSYRRRSSLLRTSEGRRSSATRRGRWPGASRILMGPLTGGAQTSKENTYNFGGRTLGEGSKPIIVSIVRHKEASQTDRCKMRSKIKPPNRSPPARLYNTIFGTQWVRVCPGMCTYLGSSLRQKLDMP